MATEYAEVEKLVVSAPRSQELHLDTFNALKDKPVEDWEPIVISGSRVVDGLQRILAARCFGYKQIPCKRVK